MLKGLAWLTSSIWSMRPWHSKQLTPRLTWTARQLLNLDPGHRLAALGALANQLQARIVLEHLIVTVHAGGTGGDIGEPGLLDAGVAVAAIHSQLAGMRRVRKRHRLDRLITHPRVFGCKIIPDTRRHGAAHQQKAGDNHHRQPVGPLWEDGRHPGPSLTSRNSVAHSSKAQTARTKQKLILAENNQPSIVLI